MAYTYEDPQYVVHVCNMAEDNEITVVFEKKNGEQRKITGKLVPPPDGKFTVNYRVLEETETGLYKTFYVDKVLLIQQEV